MSSSKLTAADTITAPSLVFVLQHHLILYPDRPALSIFIYPTKWLLALRIALALSKPVGKGKGKVSLM